MIENEQTRTMRTKKTKSLRHNSLDGYVNCRIFTQKWLVCSVLMYQSLKKAFCLIRVLRKISICRFFHISLIITWYKDFETSRSDEKMKTVALWAPVRVLKISLPNITQYFSL